MFFKVYIYYKLNEMFKNKFKIFKLFLFGCKNVLNCITIKICKLSSLKLNKCKNRHTK